MPGIGGEVGQAKQAIDPGSAKALGLEFGGASGNLSRVWGWGGSGPGLGA